MNNKYFNKVSLFAMATLLIIATGCKKYLNQEPITDLSTDVVFKDVPSTYKAIAGVYSRLVGDQGYGIRVSLYFPLDNDEMQGPTGAADNDRRDIGRYAATSGNAQISSPFNQMFQGIEYANVCIANIPKMAMYTGGTANEQKQLQRMYGEALTLRAQFYFEAIRNWGDLPAHFTPAADQILIDPFPFRVNRDTLYDHLIADLKTAEDLVPWKNEVASIGDQLDERITKAAVKGLRARIALFRGGYSLRLDTKIMERRADYLKYYQIARDECNDIMTSGQHSLNPSFKSLWKDQVNAHAVTDPNGELIFQTSAIGLTGAEDTKLGYYNGPTVNALGNKSVNVLPNYFYLFDSTDTRRDVTCAPYNVNANGSTKTAQAITAICDGKYRRDWISNPVISPTNAVQYLGLKWQILRYSDVMLMFAEADNEINGPTAAAYNALNQVRRRGYGKPIGTADASVDIPAGLSKTDFFKAIVRERSLELGGEGIRKYDLLRWNLLAAALGESKANMTKMSANAAMINPTYMAAYPSYSTSVALPTAMYYLTNSVADDGAIWGNSLYKYSPFADPAITYNTQTGNYTLLPSDYGVIPKGQTNVITLPNATAVAGRIYWVKYTPNFPGATNASWTYSMKVNTVSSQTIDGSGTSNTYSGTVAATTAPATPTVNGPTKIIGFYSNGSNWITATTIVWVTSAINTTAISRYATGFTPGKSELLPIPQPARDGNYNLTQNPGY